MSNQPEALRLADALNCATDDDCGYCQPCVIAAELRRLSALVAACEPYLKDGETPAERIERERGDTEAVCRLYAKEREKNQELLDALKALVNNEDAGSWGVFGVDDRDAFAKARAAIAKAEGQA